MENTKHPRWSLDEAVNSGSNCVMLVNKYLTELGTRIDKNSFDEFANNVTLLTAYQVIQPENLMEQKTKTSGKSSYITQANKKLSAIKYVVRRNETATNEIKKAFGIGTSNSRSIAKIEANVNMVSKAFSTFETWCTGVGILQADIDALKEVITILKSKNKEKSTTVYSRKDDTFDKNNLQRKVEASIINYSSIGMLQFSGTDAAIAKLFYDLIPVSENEEEETVEETTETQDNTSTKS